MHGDYTCHTGCPPTPHDHAGRHDHLRQLMLENEHEIQQVLGKALGYPRYKDDQKNFPGATEEDGVCVGDHAAVTLALEAASRIEQLEGWAERCQCA